MQQTSKTNRWSVVINVWPSFAFIAEKSIQLVDTPKGWITFTGSPLYLHGAALMDGPPEKLGELSATSSQAANMNWFTPINLMVNFLMANGYHALMVSPTK